MSRAARSLFLERQTYRARRLGDAARLLPLLGVFLFAVPILWPRGPGEEAARAGMEAAGAEAVRGSVATIYVFGVWALLIAAAFWLSRALRGAAAAAARESAAIAARDGATAPAAERAGPGEGE